MRTTVSLDDDDNAPAPSQDRLGAPEEFPVFSVAAGAPVITDDMVAAALDGA